MKECPGRESREKGCPKWFELRRRSSNRALTAKTSIGLDKSCQGFLVLSLICNHSITCSWKTVTQPEALDNGGAVCFNDVNKQTLSDTES